MPIEHQLEVSVGLTQSLLDALRLEGIADTKDLLKEAGIDARLLEKPENRVPFDQQQALWRLAVERSASNAFGLHFARCMQPTSVGLLGYMAMNCRTIDESFEAIVKYQFLAGQGGEFSLQREASKAYLAYTPINPEDPVTAQRVIGMLAATVSFGRWLVGEALRPLRVEFAHEQPESGADYEEFFACPIAFGQSANRLVYDQATTELAIPNASEDLLLLLSERANRLLGSLSRSSGIATRIASLLATQLNARVPDKSVIASQLGMSERTLQRRLQDEGTSFQEILDNTRHYLARELLKNTDIPLAEVAAQLGFSEPSTFFRAFKKWEGSTPGQYRGSASA